MSTKYEYKRPNGKLYKISVKRWNKYFGNRGRFQVVECYVTDTKITFHFLPYLMGKILVVAFLPITILWHGPANTKEIMAEIKRCISPKKYGSFSSEEVFNNERQAKSWAKAKKMLGLD
jgi:hypothetical protein